MEMPFDSFVALYTKDTDGCMKKRNRYMVDQSAYCICTHLYPMSGTEQTVKYARRKGLRIINVAD